jgi:hypothetical protein
MFINNKFILYLNKNHKNNKIKITFIPEIQSGLLKHGQLKYRPGPFSLLKLTFLKSNLLINYNLFYASFG